MTRKGESVASSARIDALLAEYERVWRARTPAREIDDILAYNRVTWTDMMAFDPELTAIDRLWLQPELIALLKRLRTEFPNERWT